MKTSTKRALAFFLTSLCITALFWTAGFDFDARGPNLAAWLGLCFWFGGLASTYPFAEDRA